MTNDDIWKNNYMVQFGELKVVSEGVMTRMVSRL